MRRETATKGTIAQIREAIALKADASSLSSTYVTKADDAWSPSNTIALLGDSITAQNDILEVGPPSIHYRSGTGFMNWTLRELSQRLRIVARTGTANGGVSGDTSALALSRLQEDVIDLAPGWCHVLLGTNDAHGDVPFATTAANLTAIYDALDLAHIRIVAGTIPPSDTATAPRLIAIEQINAFIRGQATTRPGMVLADYHAVLADADGTWRVAADTTDGVHPSAAGALRMGHALALALAPITQPVTILPTSNVYASANAASFDAPNMTTNPLMVGVSGEVYDSITGTLANSWLTVGFLGVNNAGATTASKVARIDGKPGEWQQFVHTDVSKGAVIRHAFTVAPGTILQAGDTVTALAEFETDDLSALTVFRTQVTFMDASYALTGLGLDQGIPTGETIPLALMADGVMMTPATVIPATTTLIWLVVDMCAVGTIRLGRVALIRSAR